MLFVMKHFLYILDLPTDYENIRIEWNDETNTVKL